MADREIVSWLRAIFALGVALCILVCCGEASRFRQKTDTENRLDELEWGRRDQRQRNKAQDSFNELVLRMLKDQKQ